MIFLFNLGDERILVPAVKFHGFLYHPRILISVFIGCAWFHVGMMLSWTNKLTTRTAGNGVFYTAVSKVPIGMAKGGKMACKHQKVDSFKAFVSTETADFEGKGMIAFIMTRVFSLL